MNVYVILTSCEVPRLAILHLVGKSWYMEIGLHPGVLKNLRDTIDRTLRGEQPPEGTMHKCNEGGTSYLCSYPEYKNDRWTGNWVTVVCDIEEHSVEFSVIDNQAEGCELHYHTTADETQLKDLIGSLDNQVGYFGGYETYAKGYEQLREEAKRKRQENLKKELSYDCMDEPIPTYNKVDCLSYEDLERVHQNNRRRYYGGESYLINGEARDGKGLYQIHCVQKKEDADAFIRPKKDNLRISLHAEEGVYTMTWTVGGGKVAGDLATSELGQYTPEEYMKLYKEANMEALTVEFTVGRDTLRALAGYLRNPEEGADAYSKSGEWVWSVGWHEDKNAGHVSMSKFFPRYEDGVDMWFDGRQHLSVGFDEGFKTRLLEAIEYVLEVDTSLTREFRLDLRPSREDTNFEGDGYEGLFCMEHNVGYADTDGNKKQCYAS